MTKPFPQNVTHHKHNFDIKPTTKTTIHIDLPVVHLEPSIIVNDSDSDSIREVHVLHGFDCDGHEYIIRLPKGVLQGRYTTL